MFTFETLEISGYRGEPLPHTFMRQESETGHLAVLLPGVGYTVHMPLLYYPMRVLTLQGADVLRVETMYVREPAFDTLSALEKARWVFQDAAAACRAALAQRAYKRLTLVGKSLGTLAMGQLLAGEDTLPQTQAIWLTPLLWHDALRAQIREARPRSLFAAGTADRHYDARLLAEVQEATGGEAVVIEGANHSLEIEDDVPASLRALERVTRAVIDFIV